MPGALWPWMNSRSPGMAVAGRAPEVVEADVVQRRRRGEAGDVAAEVTGLAVGAHHHRHRVPADDRADAPFQFGVAGALGFQLRGDGVDVLGGRGERQVSARTTGQLDHAFQQLMRALRPFDINDGLQRLDPLLGFQRVRIVVQHLVQPVHRRSQLRHAHARLFVRFRAAKCNAPTPAHDSLRLRMALQNVVSGGQEATGW